MIELSKDFKFKKKFGQNFIFDKNFLITLVDDFKLPKTQNVLEIGAGAGTLTQILCKDFEKVVSFEIDQTLKEKLIEIKKSNSNLELFFKDILSVDTKDIDKLFSKNYVMIANLPYYITSPIIFKFLFESKFISKMFVMVQKEVGERFCAVKNTKEYGIPSVLLKTFGSCKIVKNVKRTMFFPIPKVDSCIIKIDIENKYKIKNTKEYCDFVSNCFKMKRKTLLNNLLYASYKKEEILKTFQVLNLQENLRAENLDESQFVSLFSILTNLK